MQVRSAPKRLGAVAGWAALAMGLVAVLPALAGAATAPEPTYGAATVDGSTADWDAGDAWGTMASNDPPNRTVASVSLRYDCTTGTLFALVTASPGEIFQTIDADEAYIRLGASGKLVHGLSGNDGTAPDFSWVDQTGDTAAGFEASAAVAPGSYPASLRIHAKMPNDSADGYETVDLKPRYSDLVIVCPVDTTTTSTSTSTTETTVPTTLSTSTSSTSTSSTSTSTSTSTTVTSTTPPEVEGTVQTSVPPTDPSNPADPAVAGARTELARTGSSNGGLSALGFGLMISGLVLVLRSHSLRREHA